MTTVNVDGIQFGGDRLVLIAGPCVLENWPRSLAIARALKDLTAKMGLPFVFKASFDKANRSAVTSFRGPGLEEGLRMLAAIKNEIGVPVLSDVHCVAQVEEAAEVLDIIQIPAFLCRQTDLLIEAALTQRAVNIKKGQFLSPYDLQNVVNKLTSVGNNRVLLTERGTTFGYNNLVVDMRSLAIMRGLGFPVIFDATHSVQLPGGGGTVSSGQRQFIAPLARAAVAVGVDGLFLEVHDDPDQALSDGPNMLPLDQLPELLTRVAAIDRLSGRRE
ncbi:MAG: 3-deoxy-8-phosphooctulonate synthase [Negativicutes bacterium]|nr:3-deoxy-8-phosphooctulonate synthase [Negativicutes bacterium]